MNIKITALICGMLLITLAVLVPAAVTNSTDQSASAASQAAAMANKIAYLNGFSRYENGAGPDLFSLTQNQTSVLYNAIKIGRGVSFGVQKTFTAPVVRNPQALQDWLVTSNVKLAPNIVNTDSFMNLSNNQGSSLFGVPLNLTAMTAGNTNYVWFGSLCWLYCGSHLPQGDLTMRMYTKNPSNGVITNQSAQFAYTGYEVPGNIDGNTFERWSNSGNAQFVLKTNSTGFKISSAAETQLGVPYGVTRSFKLDGNVTFMIMTYGSSLSGMVDGAIANCASEYLNVTFYDSENQIIRSWLFPMAVNLVGWGESDTLVLGNFFYPNNITRMSVTFYDNRTVPNCKQTLTVYDLEIMPFVEHNFTVWRPQASPRASSQPMNLIARTVYANATNDTIPQWLTLPTVSSASGLMMSNVT